MRTKFTIFEWPLCAGGFHLGCIPLNITTAIFFYFDQVVHHNNLPFLRKILLAFNIKKI